LVIVMHRAIARVSLRSRYNSRFAVETPMARFAIEAHFRLQEWVAEQKGYFRAEGLDYEFREYIHSTDGAHHETTGKTGAFQSIEAGRSSNVTCACHWTVNVAASRGHTKLFADAYSVAPSGIFVPAGSPIRTPADLDGVPISVSFQSGSHYATIQALEPYLRKDQINLAFGDGMLFHRMEAFLDGKAPAATLFNGPYYFAEQLGYRKIIDTTFMIAAMINGSPDPEDVRRYFRALRRAQRDIDVRPELYTHHYAKEFPARFHARMDTRRWGPGERLVFEPYSKEVFDASFRWIATHELFEADAMGSGNYEQSIVSLATE
jgi:ABC-type nitrate/sulfonate/bicarbonate transport system substrate-binding protein